MCFFFLLEKVSTIDTKLLSVSTLSSCFGHKNYFCKKHKTMTKEKDKIRELARAYYMQGLTQKEIAQKVGVSNQTLNRWCSVGSWATLRAATTISRQELVNKLLLSIDKIITDISSSHDPKQIAGLGDRLSKLAATIEKLDKKESLTQTITVFTSFLSFLRATSVDSTVILQFSSLMDLYIKSKV